MTKSKPCAYGYDGLGYTIGDRVELHPGCDLWMQGARYGTVVGMVPTPNDRIRVKLDKTGERVWSGSEDMFRRIGHEECEAQESEREDR